MNTTYLIKEAILSEKAHEQMTRGVYAFRVDRRSTKKEIASAIKKQFGVDVVSVNIIAQSPKKRRITGTRKEVEIKGAKKAIIKVKPGQTIAMLAPKTEAKKEKPTKSTRETEKTKKSGKGLLSRIRKSEKSSTTEPESKSKSKKEEK